MGGPCPPAAAWLSSGSHPVTSIHDASTATGIRILPSRSGQRQLHASLVAMAAGEVMAKRCWGYQTASAKFDAGDR